MLSKYCNILRTKYKTITLVLPSSVPCFTAVHVLLLLVLHYSTKLPPVAYKSSSPDDKPNWVRIRTTWSWTIMSSASSIPLATLTLNWSDSMNQLHWTSAFSSPPQGKIQSSGTFWKEFSDMRTRQHFTASLKIGLHQFQLLPSPQLFPERQWGAANCGLTLYEILQI